MNMCVAPGHRRQGLGRRIMLHLINTAKKQHLRHAWLEVRSHNQSAITLYERLGFVRLTVRKGYYKLRTGREDALVMARKL